MEDDATSESVSTLTTPNHNNNPREAQKNLVDSIEGVIGLSTEELNQIQFDTSEFSEKAEEILELDNDFNLPRISDERMRLDIGSDLLQNISSLDRHFRHLVITKAVSQALEVNKHKAWAQKILARKTLEKRREKYFMLQAQKRISVQERRAATPPLAEVRRADVVEQASSPVPFEAPAVSVLQPLADNEQEQAADLREIRDLARAYNERQRLNIPETSNQPSRESEILPRLGGSFVEERVSNIGLQVPPPERAPSLDDIRKSVQASDMILVDNVQPVDSQWTKDTWNVNELPAPEGSMDTDIDLQEIEKILSEDGNEVPAAAPVADNDNENIPAELNLPEEQTNVQPVPEQQSEPDVEITESQECRVPWTDSQSPARLVEKRVAEEEEEEENATEDDSLEELPPVPRPERRRRRVRPLIVDNEIRIRNYAERANRRNRDAEIVGRVAVYRGPPAVLQRLETRNVMGAPGFGNHLFHQAPRAEILGRIFHRHQMTEPADENDDARRALPRPRRAVASPQIEHVEPPRAERRTVREVVAEETIAIPQQAIADESLAIPREIAPHEALLNFEVPEEAAPILAIPQDVIPQETVPNLEILQEVAPLPQEAEPILGIPLDVALREAEPNLEVPQEEAQEEVLPNLLIPQEIAPLEGVPNSQPEGVIPEPIRGVSAEETAPREGIAEQSLVVGPTLPDEVEGITEPVARVSEQPLDVVVGERGLRQSVAEERLLVHSSIIEAEQEIAEFIELNRALEDMFQDQPTEPGVIPMEEAAVEVNAEQQRIVELLQQASAVEPDEVIHIVPEQLRHLVGTPVSTLLQPAPTVEEILPEREENIPMQAQPRSETISASPNRIIPERQSPTRRSPSPTRPRPLPTFRTFPSERLKEFSYIETILRQAWELCEEERRDKTIGLRELLEKLNEYSQENALVLLRVLDKMSLKKRVILKDNDLGIMIQPFEVPYISEKCFALYDEPFNF